MSILKRLLPTKDNIARRLILSEILGQPVAVRLMQQHALKHKQMQRSQTTQHVSSNESAYTPSVHQASAQSTQQSIKSSTDE